MYEPTAEELLQHQEEQEIHLANEANGKYLRFVSFFSYFCFILWTEIISVFK
jgi:hypothetical protein